MLKLKRFFPFTFACSLILTVLLTASCSKTDSSSFDITTAVTVETSESTTTTEHEKLVPNLPGKTFGGKEVKFLDRSPEYDNWYGSIDIYASELNGEVVNDAVFNRNTFVESKYDVIIGEYTAPDILIEAQKSVLAGDSSYDVFAMPLVNTGILSVKGYLMNLYDIENLDLNQPWWDQSAKNDLTIKNNLFAALGDIIVQDDWGMWRILFNKDIISQYQMDSPYSLVKDGKWTIDKIHKMASEATVDINGDGKVDEEDQWGYTTEAYNLYIHHSGSGEKYAVLNSDGSYELTIKSERSITAFQAAFDLMYDNSCTFIKNEFKYSNKPSDIWASALAMFGEGRVLFDMAGLDDLPRFRNYELNFGILPIPKLDEKQDAYYCGFSNVNTVGIAIPKQDMDYECIGIILEAMAAESKYTLTPAYFETLLMGKSLYDSESEEMLKLMLSSRCYDLAIVYDVGKCSNLASNLVSSRSRDVVSAIDKIGSAMIKDMDFMMEAISNSK